MCLFELWFSQGLCPEVGLLGHMVVLLLVFKGTSILFSIVAVSIYIPTNSARGFAAIKRNEIGSFAEMWMDLESVIQSEVSQKEKNKYHMLMHLCGI